MLSAPHRRVRAGERHPRRHHLGASAAGRPAAHQGIVRALRQRAIPLREALSRLATSGFVVAEDQRGFRVADVSAAELTDITDTRIHVECEALRAPSRRAGWTGRAPGRRALPAGPGGAAAAGRQRPEPGMGTGARGLHSALISGSGSNSLIAIAELLRDQTARYRHLSVAGASGPRRRPDATWRGSTASCWRPRWRATRSAPRTCWPSICAAPPSWCWRTRRGNGARARVSGAPSPAGQRLMIIV